MNVQCNIAEGSLVNGKRSNVIYPFKPTVPPGYDINIDLSNVIYYPVISTKNRILDITVEIRDQDDKLVDFRERNVMLYLNLRKVK